MEINVNNKTYEITAEDAAVKAAKLITGYTGYTFVKGVFGLYAGMVNDGKMTKAAMKIGGTILAAACGYGAAEIADYAIQKVIGAVERLQTIHVEATEKEPESE